MLADTHCHLYFESFDADHVSVIQRAEETGVVRILNPGLDIKTSRQAIDLARENPSLFAAVGFHPNEGSSWTDGSLDELRELASAAKVVAIGEIGLDYYWDTTARDLQWSIFETQLDLAAAVGLPVVVHTRDKPGESLSAMTDALCALERWISGLKDQNPELYTRPGVLHSFSGDLSAAERAVKMGFSIGISGPVTFKNAELLKSVVKAVPVENLLSETDAPFLTPIPHRGKRNEPAFVRFVVAEMANQRGMDLDLFSEIILSNAKRLFHW